MREDTFGEQPVGQCILFGIWKICIGDKVVLVDVRGRAISGVVRGFYAGFIALSASCDDDKPSRFTKIQYIMEINLVGSCQEEADRTDKAEGRG